MRETHTFKGISMRLARGYLESVGGEIRDDETVTGPGWHATLSNGTVEVGPSLELTEVTVVFDGKEAALEEVIPAFEQKAIRAGG